MCVCMCVCEGVKNVRKMYEKRGGLLETYENVEGGRGVQKLPNMSVLTFRMTPRRNTMYCILQNSFYTKEQNTHCVKIVHIWSFSGPYFPVLGLNSEIYSVSLRIQSECAKIRTRKTPNTGTFHAMAKQTIVS